MPATAWRLPGPPLRARALAAALAAIAGALGAAFLLRQAAALGPWYAVRSGFVLAAMLAVAAGGLRAHHPHARLGSANLVTASRAALVALVAGLLLEPAGPAAAWCAIGLAVATMVLDGVDGRLARREGTASDFGARFDMEVDALLVLVLAALAWRFEKAGAWVLASGLLRYAFVAAGAALPWLARPLPPRRRRQTVCVVQLVSLTVALAPFLDRPLSGAAAGVGLLVLAWSFAVDVAWLHARRTAVP